VAALSTEKSNPRGRSVHRRAAELIAQAADALEHAHGLGIVHRDVKPGNLLLDETGKLYVSDFGLAGFGPDAGLTMSGDLLGTLRYMAPEQALARHGLADHRVDVYGLGCTLYELLTRRPAVDAVERTEVLRRIAFEEPTPPRKIDKSISAELETVTLKCLAKNPAERYAAAGELAEDLKRWLADQAIRARPPNLVQRARRWGRRHRTLAWSAAAVVLLALVMVACSLGYVASERATRWGEMAPGIGQALDESDDFQRRGNYTEALSAARRAERLSAGESAGSALRDRAERRRAGFELVLRLDEARLEGTAVKDGHFDGERTIRLYEEEFRAEGIDVEAATADLVERIRGTTVAVELAAVLDDWAGYRKAHAGGKPDWKHLSDAARGADPDEWRPRLRDALAAGGTNALKELGTAEGITRQPARSLVALSAALSQARETKASLRLLLEAQRAYPGDFWINHNLGMAQLLSKPAQYKDAVRYLSVAVAVRPESPGARLNLGMALKYNGLT
jgi:tetratricopeptide (TPR) repeat protein